MRPKFTPTLVTEKGRPRYVDQATKMTYTMDKMSKDGETEFWRCDFRGNCRARLHVLNGKVVKRVNKHVHPAGASKREVVNTLKVVEEPNSNTDDETALVVAEEIIPEPSIKQERQLQMKKYHEKQKRLSFGLGNNPESLAAMKIPQEFQQYENVPGAVEDFLLYDGGASAGDDRILIFATEQNLNFLCRVSAWYLDGTFDKAPPLFSLVCTIHGSYQGQTYPLVFGLLPNRCQATYENFFTQVSELTYGNLAPVSIVTYYEEAAISALQIVYPDAEINGCFFHLGQDVQRIILQDEEMQQEYERDLDFAIQCRMIAAVALVPPDDVEDVFNELSDLLPRKLQPVLNYFEDTYVGRRRRPPIYPIEFWNMFHRILDGESCITSSVEAWHRVVQSMMGGVRPSIWKFIRGLIRCQKVRDAEVEHLINGDLPYTKRNKLAALKHRIIDLVNDYPNRPKMEYLRELAQNISF